LSMILLGGVASDDRSGCFRQNHQPYNRFFFRWTIL
jgi:hypothetical protein